MKAKFTILAALAAIAIIFGGCVQSAQADYYYYVGSGNPYDGSIYGDTGGYYYDGYWIYSEVPYTYEFGDGSAYYCTGYDMYDYYYGYYLGSGSDYWVNFPIYQDTYVYFNFSYGYYLTISTDVWSTYGDGEGWYYDGYYINAYTNDPIQDGDILYYCTGWTAYADWYGYNMYSGSYYYASFPMYYGPITLTWTWEKYYYLRVYSDIGEVSPGGDGEGWYYDGSTVTATIDQTYILVDGQMRYNCTGYTASGATSNGTTAEASFSITEPTTITFTWEIQWYFDASIGTAGVSTTVQGNGAGWYSDGSTVRALVATTVGLSPGVRWYTSGCTVGGDASFTPAATYDTGDFTINSYTTVVFTYSYQYQYTATSDRSLIVGSQSGWFDEGASIESSVATPTAPVGGIRYDCRGWSGTGSIGNGTTINTGTFTINSPTTVTFTWQLQYLYTVDTGRPTVPALYSNTGWYDDGTPLHTAVQLHDVIVPNKERFECRGFSATGSALTSASLDTGTFTLGAPTTVTFKWQQQFTVTIVSPGIEVFGTQSGWYDAGTEVISTTAEICYTTQGTRYVLLGWTIDADGTITNGTGTSIPVYSLNKALVITWNRQRQFKFDAATAYSVLTGTAPDWYNEGQSITVGVDESLIYASPRSRANCKGFTAVGGAVESSEDISVTFDLTAPTSITYIWTIEHDVIINCTNGSASPESGWYEAGAVVDLNASANEPMPGQRFIWVGWQGSGEGSVTTSDGPEAQITVFSPITENAVYKVQYYLTLASAPVGGTFIPDATGWHDEGELIEVRAVAPQTTTGMRYQLSWVGAGAGSYSEDLSAFTLNPITIRMREAIIQTAVWGQQYSLTVLNPAGYGVAVPSVGTYWFYPGETVSGVITPFDTKNRMTGYIGTGGAPSGSTNSYSFALNAPGTITWQWASRTSPVEEEWNAPVRFLGETASLIDMVRDSSGTPYIAYYSTNSGSIKLATVVGAGTKVDAEASVQTWSVKVVVEAIDDIDALRVAISPDGDLFIAYHVSTSNTLFFGYKTVSGWTIAPVVEVADKGMALTALSDGTAIVVCRDALSGNIVRMHYMGGTYDSKTVVRALNGVTSLDYGIAEDSGIEWVAYADSARNLLASVKLLGEWQTTSIGDNAVSVNLALGPSGVPFVTALSSRNLDGTSSLQLYYISRGSWESVLYGSGMLGTSCGLVADGLGNAYISVAKDGQLMYSSWDGQAFVDNVIDSGLVNTDLASSAFDGNYNAGIAYTLSGTVRYANYKANSIKAGDYTSGSTDNGGVVTSGGGGGCFVATAAFGTLASDSVVAFTSMRDSSVISSTNGASLISLYYAVSPSVATAISRTESARAILRAILQ
ncbi:MAG: CFI-box-CTERM domain-containing protein [Candidatus Brocadiia bacterium]